MKYKEWYDKYVKEEAKQKDLLNAVKLAMSLQLNNLTDDEKDVLTKMTGALSQKINYNIGHGESLDKFADQIELIDSAINKGVIPEDLDLIRKTIPQYVFSNAKKIDLEFLQSQKGQEEVLFKRGLKYRIYDAKIEDDKYVLFAEVIDDEKRRR